jgi:hypothetical protein
MEEPLLRWPADCCRPGPVPCDPTWLRCSRQRVVGALASRPCKSAAVGDVSQDSRSRVSADEHVGEHSNGVAGWRALAGSGGIRGGATGVGDKGTDAFGQALRSGSSRSGVSLRSHQAGVCFIVDHLLGVGR